MFLPVQGPASNWSRYVTYLRGAVENLHAALWGVWPGLKRKQSESMNAVGMPTVNKYFNWWVIAAVLLTIIPSPAGRSQVTSCGGRNRQSYVSGTWTTCPVSSCITCSMRSSTGATTESCR